MAYAMFVDDELKPMEAPPDQRSVLPALLHADVDSHSAQSLLAIIEREAGDDIAVESYWNPKEAAKVIETAANAPLVLVLDILNERQSLDTRISADGRCGLVLAEKANLRWPDTPIIFLTQFNCYMPERKRVAKIDSTRDFITKRTDATIELLEARLRAIFEKHRAEPGIKCGPIRFDPVTPAVFWRKFEMGTIANAIQFPQLKSNLNLINDTNLPPAERRVLHFMMLRAEASWPDGKPARATINEICRECGVPSEDMVHQYTSRIRRRFAKAEEALYGGVPPEIFENEKLQKSYVFREEK